MVPCFYRHMFVDARMSVDGGSGLNNNGIAQVILEVLEFRVVVVTHSRSEWKTHRSYTNA